MPSQVIDGCDISEDTTVQFLTSQQDLVHHGQCDGVRAGEAFLRHMRVTAVDVVDLNVGRRSQRVGDDTFFRVSLFQVILRLGVRHVQSQFQPLLQLGIQIGTYGETVEVTADDGTFLIHITA